MPGHKGASVRYIAFYPIDDYVASASVDGSVKVCSSFFTVCNTVDNAFCFANAVEDLAPAYIFSSAYLPKDVCGHVIYLFV